MTDTEPRHPFRHRIASYIFNPYTYAIALGLGGGAVFAWAGAPLAWLLGAMTVTTVAAFAGVNVRVHDPFRSLMIIILGVMLGSSFQPELLSQIPGWGLAAILMIIALAGLTAIAFIFLRYVGGYDPVTSYFSSTPGGINVMVIVGEAAGGDTRTISLTHAVRVLFVVSVIPIYFRFVVGLDVPAQPANAISILNFNVLEGLILIACGAVGFPLAKLLRFPAPALLGPTLLSAGAHLSGISHVPPPAELIAVAQVVIGAAIGSRFAGITFREVWKTAIYAAGVAILMVGVAALLAPLGAEIVSVSAAAMFLALVPGGLTEMSPIALSMGIDTAFVSTMHILRIVFIIAFAPLAFQMGRGVIDKKR